MLKPAIILPLLLALIILGTTPMFAQNGAVLLQATVVDYLGQPISGVNVIVEGDTRFGTASDERGFFQLEVSQIPVYLIFSHINFETKKINVAANNPLPQRVVLYPNIQELPDVMVPARKQIDTVYREPYSVTDYQFYQNRILLLACQNSWEGFSLILLDQEKKVRDVFSLRQWRPKSLYRSCSGTLYLITGAQVLEIRIEEDRIVFGESIARQDFSDGLENCVLANDSLAYFQRYFYQGQALRYYGIPRENYEGSLQNFPLIEDDRNIVLLIEESGCRLPWSGDVWEEEVPDKLRDLRESRYGLSGMWRVFYPPIYAPLFPKDSLLCRFNHFASQLEYFDAQGKLIHQQAIDYHQRKKWAKQLYFDTYLQQVYTSFRCDEGELFYSIDMETGQLGFSTLVPMHYIENVQVWNGSLYYLYRNRGKQERNRMLHRLKLN